MKITKENFKPTGHLVLVKKLQMKYRTVTRPMPMDNGGDINKEVEVEEVKEKVYYNQQLAGEFCVTFHDVNINVVCKDFIKNK